MSWLIKAENSNPLIKEASVQDFVNWLKSKTNYLLPLGIAAALWTTYGPGLPAQFAEAKTPQQAQHVVHKLHTRKPAVPPVKTPPAKAPATKLAPIKQVPVKQAPAFQQAPHDNAPVNIDLWIDRVIHQESGGKANARSGKGARGLMQIMPATWAEETKEIYGKPLPFSQADDPKICRVVGTHYLKKIQRVLRGWMGKEPNIEQILAAYNGGWGALKRVHFNWEKMPNESVNYARSITHMQPRDTQHLPSHKKNMPMPENFV